MKQQIAANWSVTRIPGIVNTITKNVEVGVGGGKTLDVPTLYEYANLAYGLPSGNFQQVQIENISGYNELSASQTSIDDAVNDFMNPDVSAPEKAATAALGEKPKQQQDTGPRPSKVSVEVLNGNGVAGAADQAAVALGDRGYPVTNGGNADKFNYFKTKILYDPASRAQRRRPRTWQTSSATARRKRCSPDSSSRRCCRSSSARPSTATSRRGRPTRRRPTSRPRSSRIRWLPAS